MSLSRALWRGGLWDSQLYANGLWRGGLWNSQRTAVLSELQSLINDLFGEGQQGGCYVSEPVVLGEQRLWQDSARTVPVTADGDPVGARDDLSGNGNHVTQSTAAHKLVYRTDGTLHWLEGDGVDDHFMFPLAPFRDTVTGSDIFVAVKSTKTSNAALSSISDRSSYLALAAQGSSSDVTEFEFSLDNYRFSGTPTSNPTRGDIYTEEAGTSVMGLMNVTTNVSPNTVQHVMLAGRASTSLAYHFGGNDYGWIEVLGGNSNISGTEDYLADRAGITL